ncbi:unnamed protein product [Didymodactylos carnosus]|uniref:Uncharacterized protein n=1 Tax=Didymodactylos carnosus TaxID=1234261 RepID=A0A814KCW3_9BILA|nr:unnamed protein product [Didymodactylos carnosus]CAF1552568.1 unnamed protein product [Didymodactylos carnosus]CAF3818853.1 unnamed protein product [Didymodactylos carnosus]CAF4343019.1 unnamed protein product [Didymodactylos carnosus]
MATTTTTTVAATTTTINIHSSPDEVLFYANDTSYEFVEQYLDVLKVECEALDDIQIRVCFKLKDNTYMVKPGMVVDAEGFLVALRAKDKNI